MTQEQLFELFVEKHSTNMRFPFQIDDYTYATNGQVLIRCKNESIDFEIKKPIHTPPPADKIIPEPNSFQRIEIESIDWTKLNTEVVYEKECDYCNGNGECDDVLYHKGKSYAYEFECPVCEGKGEYDDGTGRTYIKLGNVYFDSVHFYLLKKVKDFAQKEGSIITIESSKHFFKIGDFEVLIHPAFSVETSDIVIEIKEEQ